MVLAYAVKTTPTSLSEVELNASPGSLMETLAKASIKSSRSESVVLSLSVCGNKTAWLNDFGFMGTHILYEGQRWNKPIDGRYSVPVCRSVTVSF